MATAGENGFAPEERLSLANRLSKGSKGRSKKKTNLETELVRPLVRSDRIARLGDRSSLHVMYIDCIAKLLGGELEVTVMLAKLCFTKGLSRTIYQNRARTFISEWKHPVIPRPDLTTDTISSYIVCANTHIT